MTRVRYRVLIGGRVQGVNFRAATRGQALAHYIDGWVRNLPDGRVEAVFEGEQEDVDRILEWSRQGPPAALVTEVQEIPEPYRGEMTGFEVRYDGWE